jgi:hypothetical protein
MVGLFMILFASGVGSNFNRNSSHGSSHDSSSHDSSHHNNSRPNFSGSSSNSNNKHVCIANKIRAKVRMLFAKLAGLSASTTNRVCRNGATTTACPLEKVGVMAKSKSFTTPFANSVENSYNSLNRAWKLRSIL